MNTSSRHPDPRYLGSQRADVHPDVELLIALWQRLAQHQGEFGPAYQWLLAQPWHPDTLLAALPAATQTWLAAHPDREAQLTAARVIATFGNFMQRCPVGDRAGQIELAIAAYHLVLTVFSAATSPDDWAITLNNLATAYHQRLGGSRADNLEQAIQLYQQALAVHTPQTWPVTMTGLARAYSDRQAGNPEQNLAQAIATYQQVLPTISRQALPVAWATVTAHLAAAYGDCQGPDRQGHIDAAIDTYQQVWAAPR
ncbi:MAG TPA: tetratricopeptide repeat protein [Nodosilinea sp.]|nr:tetratricopeptide repeat protein [Nodosilinea sp.]